MWPAGWQVEAAALWVCVDAATLRPARLSERFWRIYGEAAGGRTVSSRLVHPEPRRPARSRRGRPWPLRLADLDLFDHVNNAATWAAVEDHWLRVAPAAGCAGPSSSTAPPIERDADVVAPAWWKAPRPGLADRWRDGPGVGRARSGHRPRANPRRVANGTPRRLSPSSYPRPVAAEGDRDLRHRTCEIWENIGPSCVHAEPSPQIPGRPRAGGRPGRGVESH